MSFNVPVVVIFTSFLVGSVSCSGDVAAGQLAEPASSEETRLANGVQEGVLGCAIMGEPSNGRQIPHIEAYATTVPSVSDQSFPSKGKLEVGPKVSFVDEIIRIFVSHLEPMKRVGLRVSVTDSGGIHWESVAYFRANEQGEIDPASQEPLRGSTYSGRHAMGLFWSMVPERLQPFDASADLQYEVSLESGGAVMAQERICRLAYRHPPSGNIEKEELRGDVYANFYRSEPQNVKPTIILLGGSGGQFQSETAFYLAARGYSVLDLMYFGPNGLPPRLERVPLEYLNRAIQWVRQRGETGLSDIVLMGRSRGAEYALLYASQFDDVKGVISLVGSNLAWSAKSYFRSSWTHNGNEIPFARGSLRQAVRYLWRSRGVGQDQLGYFNSATTKQRRTMNAEIEVERIRAPILLLSGKSDMQWPSAEMGERLVSRAMHHGFPFAIRHVAYHDAGHEFLAIPFIPQPSLSSMMTWASGGTTQGNALASIEAWGEIFGFLEAIVARSLDHADERS